MVEFVRQLRDYRLTTFEILYHMPDHPAILQSFVQQVLDLAPEYPEIRKFLRFWEVNIEGRLHSVRIANTPLITPGSARFVSGDFLLH